MIVPALQSRKLFTPPTPSIPRVDCAGEVTGVHQGNDPAAEVGVLPIIGHLS